MSDGMLNAIMGSEMRSPVSERSYRWATRQAVSMSLGPYGYTVTIWTSGGVLIHTRGAPSSIDALLFMLGAVGGYASVGIVSFGSAGARAHSITPPAIWAGFHVIGIGLAIGAATLVAQNVHSTAAWPLGGFAVTAIYLLVLAAQLALAGLRPVPAAATLVPTNWVPDNVAAKPVDRPEIVVMFLRTDDEPAAIQLGWERLEATIGLRGRKFFGAFYPATGEYRACVEVRKGDDPDALGLETGRLPAGRYLRTRLQGEPPQVYERIAPTFAALVKMTHPDETRPSIEFYRRRDEIDLLLPVATT
jgi:hypothetical protein